MLLADKVILISGVGPGLGQSMAKIAVQEGAKVALGARNIEFLQKLVGEITDSGGEAIAVATDVTDRLQCDAIAQATVDAFGTIDGLVNSAYNHGNWATADQADAEEWARVYDVNCVGALRMAQAVLPAMKSAGSGAIVNVSTMATVNPFPGEASYAASKGGLGVLTRHMATDFGQFNIRVNTVPIGLIKSEQVHNRWVKSGKGEDERAWLNKTAAGRGASLQRVGEDYEAGDLITFLSSDRASYITGVSVNADGGASPVT